MESGKLKLNSVLMELDMLLLALYKIHTTLKLVLAGSKPLWCPLQGTWPGRVLCKQKGTTGNTAYGDNQIIKQELNFEQGTLIFFVDGVQQPVYISGIKEKVRFFVCMYDAGSQCTIRSLQKLTSPTSEHIPNEKAINW
ncbi:MAG: hypothetical protein EZS28_049564 [Streblomastix strix]|uniref:SPRY domain-containing protein n=1 Tax=Streblomastix strix TaxID=222440 RepID=A0A5J4T9R9_9EUKA|nr:MAG: hypothetical protein EZS28_049564 [Streblomastix strix]